MLVVANDGQKFLPLIVKTVPPFERWLERSDVINDNLVLALGSSRGGFLRISITSSMNRDYEDSAYTSGNLHEKLCV